MSDKSRRNFLKTVASVGSASLALSPKKANARPEEVLSPNRMGVLVDTTVCIGCRNCEYACRKSHGIDPGDLESYHNREVFEEYRRPKPDLYTVVNEFPNPENELIPINVKDNCRHCNHPACVSACIVGAITKKDNGAVVWNTDKCIGCRYCMVACPFQIPTFEYDEVLHPDIKKCDFCNERQQEGKIPACVEICPVEAMVFAPINDVISLAKDRVRREPEKYNDHIYGLEEVGGTSWLYLSSREFKDIKFIEHETKPVPGTVESIQHGIFAYFVPPLALYAWLGGIMWISKRRSQEKKEAMQDTKKDIDKNEEEE